jgi:hypothetical protein
MTKKNWWIGVRNGMNKWIKWYEQVERQRTVLWDDCFYIVVGIGGLFHLFLGLN